MDTDCAIADMKVLVCGGSAYKDKTALYRRLDELHTQGPITLIINGGARGADGIARGWTQERRVALKTCHARPGPDRKQAFIELNKQMLEQERPALVLTCPGGAITQDLVARAELMRVRVNRM